MMGCCPFGHVARRRTTPHFGFPVTYRGQMLDLEIGLEQVEYPLREGESLVIRVLGPARLKTVFRGRNLAACDASAAAALSPTGSTTRRGPRPRVWLPDFWIP